MGRKGESINFVNVFGNVCRRQQKRGKGIKWEFFHLAERSNGVWVDSFNGLEVEQFLLFYITRESKAGESSLCKINTSDSEVGVFFLLLILTTPRQFQEIYSVSVIIELVYVPGKLGE